MTDSNPVAADADGATTIDPVTAAATAPIATTARRNLLW